MSEDEDLLREQFKKENKETMNTFKEVVKEIFGNIDEDDWD